MGEGPKGMEMKAFAVVEIPTLIEDVPFQGSRDHGGGYLRNPDSNSKAPDHFIKNS